MITTPEQADELLGRGSSMAADVKFQLARIDTRPDKTARTSDGKRPPTCSKCGFVGGRATGCGTAHGSLSSKGKEGSSHGAASPVRSAAKPKREDFDPAVRRNSIERMATVRSGQPPTLGMRAVVPLPSSPTSPPDNDDNEERWPAWRIADETRRAESSKHKGELPIPISTFDSSGFPRGGS